MSEHKLEDAFPTDQLTMELRKIWFQHGFEAGYAAAAREAEKRLDALEAKAREVKHEDV